jgi:hypothetical protein
MNREHSKTCKCQTCGKWYDPLGIMMHRKGHKNRQELCVIRYTHGDTYIHDYRKKKEA